MHADRRFMALAVAQARRGWGRTSPNPPVGAVVVDAADRVVGRGYHPRAGEPHAEVFALEQAGELARGATLYVTLEPCCHQGRTPPCTRRIIAAGVARVVVGATDPNPLVAGGGLAELARAGIRTDVVSTPATAELVEAFAKHVTTLRPFLHLKAAVTLDGRMATATGDARWVTGEAARALVHRWRDRCDAVLVGVGTVLRDDPRLTCRVPGGRDPIRVVVDSHGRTPPTARVLTGGSAAPTWVAVTAAAPHEARSALERAGAEVLTLPEHAGRVDLAALGAELGRRGVVAVLGEAGGTLNAALLRERMVDRISLFVAPKLVGGDGSPGPVGGEGVVRMADALPLDRLRCRRVGEDLWLSAYPAYPGGGEHVHGDR